MAEMESLDSKTIVELQELMGDDYLTVYEAFIRSTEAYLSELEAAVKNNDVERIGVILHTLKGSSAKIGAVRFSEICKSFMEEAKNNAGCDFMIMQKYCSDRTEGNHISLRDAVGDMETALI